MREHDLSLTHTFIDPQVNRIQFYYEQNDEPIAAKIVDKNNEGIVIQGAKLLATQGGMTDELLVLQRAFKEKKKDLLFQFQVIQKELNLFVENHLQEKSRRLIIH